MSWWMSGPRRTGTVWFTKILKREHAMAFAKQSAGSGAAGLVILRIGTGATLFLRHGWEKQPMHWAQFMAHFPNPIHIGAHASFFIAFLSDFVCSLLLTFGICTRWVARFAFFGRGPGSDHGEVMVLYLVALLTLAIHGSTAFSVDSVRGR